MPPKTVEGWKGAKEVPAYRVMPFLLDRFKAMSEDDRRRTDAAFRRALTHLDEIFTSGNADLWQGITINLDAVASLARARSQIAPG